MASRASPSVCGSCWRRFGGSWSHHEHVAVAVPCTSAPRHADSTAAPRLTPPASRPTIADIGRCPMRRLAVTLLALALLAAPLAVGGQTPGNVPRVVIIHFSGEWHTMLDGLRQGLRELGLEESKHFVLDIRETSYDLKAVEAAAKDL